jgi:hypothetical protein
MNVTFKKKELIPFWNGLRALLGENPGLAAIFKSFSGELHPDLAYEAVMVKERMKSAIEAINKANTPLTSYLEGHKKLELKHAEKDEKGDPVKAGDGYKLADQKAFEKEVEKLKSETGQDKREKDIAHMLDENIQVNIDHVPPSVLPNPIHGGLMALIHPIIKKRPVEKDNPAK